VGVGVGMRADEERRKHGRGRYLWTRERG
jgi:hypothetical protein